MIESVVAASLDAAREIARRTKLPSNAESVVIACAEEWRVGVSEVMGRRRTGEIVEARQVAMFIMRTRLDMLLTEIGRFFNKNHATAVYAVKVVDERRGLSQAFQDRVDRVRGRIDFG